MGGLTEDEAKQAEERLGALRKILGYVSIDQPIGATVEVDGAKALVPLRIHLTPGEHDIVGTRGTATTTFRVDVRAGEVKHVELDLPLEKPGAPPPKPSAEPLRPENGRLAKEHPQPAPSRAATTWGIVAMSAGVVFAGTAIVLGTQTLKARDAWDASWHTNIGKHDSAVELRTFTNVAWGAAIVAGATGTVLLLSPTIRF
jgi:hypothetical protein